MNAATASLATKAVIDAQTVAPPSFDGHGWLVALNMGVMTAVTVIGLMAIALLIRDGWRHRHLDRGWTPARLFQIVLLCFSIGLTLRCFGEALSLWGWNPLYPARTSTLLLLKRGLDPIAASFGATGLGVAVLAIPGTFHQLRKEPLPTDLWQEWPFIQRMLGVIGCSLFMAIAVVTLR